MKVEYEIYQLISKAAGSRFTLSEKAGDGLAAYVADNGLEDLMATVPAEKRMHCLELFMRPILSLPQREILLYFETYSLRLAFSQTMNKIQSEALNKLRDINYQCVCLPALQMELHTVVSEMCGYPDMYERFSEKISDCMVDLDYIAGSSQSISMSLAQRAGLRI